VSSGLPWAGQNLPEALNMNRVIQKPQRVTDGVPQKARNPTRRAAWEQLPVEILEVLEEHLDLNPNDPDYRRRLQEFINNRLRSRRNMTPEQFVQLYITQSKVCGICKKRPPGPRPKLNIDHDHNPPYAVRGLLCIRCNTDLKRYEEVGERWRQYLDSPPARQAGLSIFVTRDSWRKVPPLSEATVGRLQNRLNNGSTLRDIGRFEHNLWPATVIKYIKTRKLHLPDDRIELVKRLLARGILKTQVAKEAACTTPLSIG
jgi:Recombination endonuclease VII